MFVLKKVSFELPLPPPYVIVFPLLSFKVNDVVEGTEAILYDVREESPFKAVPPAKYWTVSPTFKPCAEVEFITAPDELDIAEVFVVYVVCSNAFKPEFEPSVIPILNEFENSKKLSIPMIQGSRSLNLSNSVSIVVYEALRQNKFQFL